MALSDKKMEELKEVARLSNLQKSALYGVSAGFLAQNQMDVDSITNQIQELISNSGSSVGGQIPEYINNITSNAVKELDKIIETDTSKKGYINDIKGITDTSTDMQLFNELHSLMVPHFEVFYEYELIHKLIPEFRRSLELIHLSIMSPDDFNKKYLIPEYKGVCNIDENNPTKKSHTKKMKDIIEEYKLEHRCSNYIFDSLKYGCKPVLVLPINEEFKANAKQILQLDTHKKDKRNGKKDDNLFGLEGAFEAAAYVDTSETFTAESVENLITDEDVNGILGEIEKILNYELDNMDPSPNRMVVEDSLNEITKTKKEKDTDKKKNLKKSIAKEVADMVSNNIKVSYRPNMSFCDQVITQYKPQLNARKKYVTETAKYAKINRTSMESTDFFLDELNLAEIPDNFNVEGVGGNAIGTESSNILNILSNIQDNITMESMWGSSPINELDPKKVKLYKDPGNDDKTRGSIVQPLAPDTVVPISIHGEHVGYYVIERLGATSEFNGFSNMLGMRGNSSAYAMGAAGHIYSSSVGNGMMIRNMVDIPQTGNDGSYAVKYELMRKLFIRSIAERLDNPDIVDNSTFNSIVHSLIKENYILKKQIKITYVPSSMMVYFAPKIDVNTGLGISIYSDTLFMAHIYIATLITNLMIKISKSADREQLWIELGVDKRVEQKVQSVIRTLQSKRISVGDMRSVDNILKTVGSFQRFIGLKNDGKPVVDIETIPGQNVDMDSDFQDKLLKSGVTSMGVPASAMNLLDETEYARSIAIQNGMFLHMIVDYQARYIKDLTKMLRILVRNKYPTHILNRRTNANKPKDATENEGHDLIDLSQVYLTLPPPNALNLTNMSDALDQAGGVIDKILDVVVDTGHTNNDVIRYNLKKKLMKKHTYAVDWDEVDSMYTEAKKNATEDILEKSETGNPDNTQEYDQ